MIAEVQCKLPSSKHFYICYTSFESMNFFPKSTNLFDRFDELAAIVKQCGDIPPKIKNGSVDSEKYAKQARKLELKADTIYQILIQEAESVFITPIDRDDIHVLAKNLDDITDLIEDVVFSMSIYKIKKSSKEYLAITTSLREITLKVSLLVQCLKKGNKRIKEMRSLITEIYTLENKGDDIARKAIASLFAKRTNAITIMKWKDIYEEIEKAFGECEHTANIVTQIVAKNY